MKTKVWFAGISCFLIAIFLMSNGPVDTKLLAGAIVSVNECASVSYFDYAPGNAEEYSSISENSFKKVSERMI